MPTLEAQEARNAERYRTLVVRISTLAVIALLAFIAVAYRTEAQQRDIKRLIAANRQNVYTSCLARVENLKKLNASYQALIAIEETNKFIDDDLRKRRIAAYRTFQLVLPDCAAQAGPGVVLTPSPTSTAQ